MQYIICIIVVLAFIDFWQKLILRANATDNEYAWNQFTRSLILKPWKISNEHSRRLMITRMLQMNTPFIRLPFTTPYFSLRSTRSSGCRHWQPFCKWFQMWRENEWTRTTVLFRLFLYFIFLPPPKPSSASFVDW